MELDELKKAWNHIQSPKTQNQNIMDIIQHKSQGPTTALKNSFRKQMLILSFMPAILILTNINNVGATLTSIFFISYVIFCIGVILFSLHNYRIVRNMEIADGAVRSNLEKQINLLETRLRINNTGLRIILVYFIILCEVVPFFQHFRMLDVWHSIHPLVRFLTYALRFVAQYYMSKKVNHEKFGQHLEYLKKLVKEMQYRHFVLQGRSRNILRQSEEGGSAIKIPKLSLC